jgi:hypothetical protein
MFQWLSTEGAALKHHIPGETNYLSGRADREGDSNEASRPFPGNRTFISEPVLSEELRNEVYVRVVEKKKSLRAVSVELGIDMKRIAAVVRLVEMERRQRAQVRIFTPLNYVSVSLSDPHSRSFFPPHPSTHMMRQPKID